MLENFGQKVTKPIIGLPLLYYFADEMMITTADNTVSFLNFLVLRMFGIYCSNYRKVVSSNTSGRGRPFQVAYEGDFRSLCTVTF